jgi:hypothetical protein
LKKLKTDQEEAWKAQSGLLLMFQSPKRVKIGPRLENNQIRRNRPRSSLGLVIFTGYEVSELRIKLACWNVERRFVVL